MSAPVKKTDEDLMSKFALNLRPEGLLALTSIKPSGHISTRTFNLPGEISALTRWALDKNKAGYNIYFTPNPVKQIITKKASVDDITRIDYVYTDIDPNTSNGYEEGRNQLLARVDEELKSNIHRPTWIIDSGNGLNVLYRLSEPLADKDKGKRLNQGLVAMFGGDPSAVDVSRILRMPYTKNYPSASKLKKGYPETPSTSSVLYGKPGVTYTVEKLDTWLQCSGSSPPTDAINDESFEDFHIEPPAPDITLDDVKAALSKLDPNMGEFTWKDVGMVMCHQGQGDIEWLDAWEEWSKSAVNYKNRHDLESRWNSWKKKNGTPGNRVKIGTLLMMAREADPNFQPPSKQDSTKSKPTEVWPTPTELGFTDNLDYTRIDDVGKIVGPADSLEDYPSPPLIDDLIKLYEVTFIYGDPKAGKTTWWIEMERRISRGEDFGKYDVEKGAVLHYTFEGTKPAKKKQRAMIQSGLLAKNDPFYLKTPDFTLDQEDAAKKIRGDIQEINSYGIQLRAICFDTLAAAAGPVDENSVKDMQPTLKLLTSLAVRYPFAIVVIHHSPKKGSGPRGSSAIRGMYDTGLEISKKDGVHWMKVIDQRDSDTEGKAFPFSILGVKGIHKHPRTRKIETAGLYSREAPNAQAIPLKPEAEKLHEALQAVSKNYSVTRLNTQHVQEAKDNWIAMIGETDKDSIRKKWAAARKQLEDRNFWEFKKQTGRGNWHAFYKDGFDDPVEDVEDRT